MAYIIFFALISQLHEKYPEILLKIDKQKNSSKTKKSKLIKNIVRKNINNINGLNIYKTGLLDSKTNKWNVPSTFNSKWSFTPTITPHERVLVWDTFLITKTGLIGSASSMEPIPFTPPKHLEGNVRYFFVKYDLKSPDRFVPIAIPGIPAAIIQLTVIKGKTPVFAKSASGVWFAKGERFVVRFAVLDTYFSEELPKLTLNNPKKEHQLRELTERYVGKFKDPNKMVQALISYFRGFNVGKLKNKYKTIQENIMSQKVGVCRHRALLFSAILQSYGIKTRFVFNEIHAFSEVLAPDGWHRIDLGGAPLNITKPINKQPEVMILDVSKSAVRGDKIVVNVDIKGSIPPVLCFSLINKKTNNSIKLKAFPSYNIKKQSIEIIVPQGLEPGEYSIKRIKCFGGV